MGRALFKIPVARLRGGCCERDIGDKSAAGLINGRSQVCSLRPIKIY